MWPGIPKDAAKPKGKVKSSHVERRLTLSPLLYKIAVSMVDDEKPQKPTRKKRTVAANKTAWNRKYDDGFIVVAVICSEMGISPIRISRRLGISTSMLYNWRQGYHSSCWY